MSIELECKVRVASLAEAREKIAAAGATYIGRVLETNRLYDDAQDWLRSAGCGLRVRSIQVLDGAGGPDTVTYKGPREPGAFKRREEIEVEIGDATVMGELLRALGYTERLIFEKRRESWMLGQCRIELDELPRLGIFVEVEGPDEEGIKGVLQAADLAGCPPVERSYVSMVAELGDGAASPLVDLRFQ